MFLLAINSLYNGMRKRRDNLMAIVKLFCSKRTNIYDSYFHFDKFSAI